MIRHCVQADQWFMGTIKEHMKLKRDYFTLIPFPNNEVLYTGLERQHQLGRGCFFVFAHSNMYWKCKISIWSLSSSEVMYCANGTTINLLQVAGFQPTHNMVFLLLTEHFLISFSYAISHELSRKTEYMSIRMGDCPLGIFHFIFIVKIGPE